MAISPLTLLTFYTDPYGEVAVLTSPDKVSYCARHGYVHVEKKGPYRDPSLYYAIDRLIYLLDLMEKPDSTEFYWVLNVQSMITNLEIPVLDLTKDCDSSSFWISRDCNALNAGSFLIRNSPRGREWVRFLIDQAPKSGAPWWENRAIIDFVETPAWSDILKVVPQRSINSYLYSQLYGMGGQSGEWQPGDLAVSMPGTNMGIRLKTVREILPRVLGRPPVSSPSSS